MLEFDEAAGRRLIATYLTPDVVEQRRAVRAALALQPGEFVLDIGSGPGLLAAEMAGEVGPSGSVVGVEPSADMRRLAGEALPAGDVAPIHYVAGDAGALPADDATMDAAVSTQVYEYVEDVPEALREARRVLRPGGRLLVLDTDWDSIVWRSGDSGRMQRMLTVWDQHLVDPHLPRRLPGLLADAGFTLTHAAAVPVLNVGFDRDTYSAGMMGFIAAFTAGRGGISEAEVQAWRDELEGLGGEYFFSVNRYLFVATT